MQVIEQTHKYTIRAQFFLQMLFQQFLSKVDFCQRNLSCQIKTELSIPVLLIVNIYSSIATITSFQSKVKFSSEVARRKKLGKYIFCRFLNFKVDILLERGQKNSKILGGSVTHQSLSWQKAGILNVISDVNSTFALLFLQ